MNWSDKLKHYVENPHAAWPQDRPLQANKLAGCVERRATALAIPPRQVIDLIIESSKRRADAAHPTLFLINCGSSGSHWIEAMLSALPEAHACGEVYLPSTLADELKSMPSKERASFLDALHQIHVEDPAATIGNADVLINSAHSWGPFDLMAGKKEPALLIRDPIEVVFSRTFRKPKLRRHMMPSASDLQYLDANIAMVDKFYRSALRRNPATVIRYEDALADPARTLTLLASLFDLHPPPERLDEIGTLFSAGSQQASSRRLSNVYMGARQDVPETMHELATQRLDAIRSKLGYG